MAKAKVPSQEEIDAIQFGCAGVCSECWQRKEGICLPYEEGMDVPLDEKQSS